MKKHEIFLCSKASEAEICTHVSRRYLTSFAGLHFENYPGLTELDAAEDRLGKTVSKTHEQRKLAKQQIVCI